MKTSVDKITHDLHKSIAELWLRARINAFAHEVAAYDYNRKDSLWFFATILFSLISIFFIIISYITQNKLDDNISKIFHALLVFPTLDYALFSIVATFFSLIITIYSNHERFSYLSERHRAIQNNYIYIAQRTRIAKDPTIKEGELIALYKGLERDFADQKSRGIEPRDKYFDKAHKIYEKIKKNPISSEAQSFHPEIYSTPETGTNKIIKNKKWLGLLQSIKLKWSHILRKSP
jgi:hypothetical protein